MWHESSEAQKRETRNEKRKEVVEAIVIRNEPVVLVARIYNLSQCVMRGMKKDVRHR